MTELSPAAQAVFSAYYEEAMDYIEEWGSFKHKRGLAAVLRAVADQVVPELSGGDVYDCCITECEHIRAELLSIAAELEKRTLAHHTLRHRA